MKKLHHEILKQLEKIPIACIYHYLSVRLLAIAKGDSPASKAGIVGVAGLEDLNIKDLEGEREMLNWERDDVAF